MDLSKAFDCIPHDPVKAKLCAFGLTQKSVIFIYSYLQCRKQKAKVNDFLSKFLTLLSGAPQGSTLGPVLFSMFLNQLLPMLKLSESYDFVDGNTILTTAERIDDLLLVQKHDSEQAVRRFTENPMIAGPHKFPAMVKNTFGLKNYGLNHFCVGKCITMISIKKKLKWQKK